MTLLITYWMLPILFTLHDFEEMIFVPHWKKRYAKKMQSLRKNYFGQTTDGPTFSVGVLEELIILLLISGFCQLTDNSMVYLAFLLAYTSHFIMHYVMCWQFKGYVPGVVTVTLQIPIILFLISYYWQFVTDVPLFVLYLLAAILVTYANLIVLHRLMATIERWFFNYEKVK